LKSLSGVSKITRIKILHIQWLDQDVVALEIPIVIRPDVIYSSERWASFRDLLLIENLPVHK
jgi:hypothetical protein